MSGSASALRRRPRVCVWTAERCDLDTGVCTFTGKMLQLMVESGLGGRGGWSGGAGGDSAAALHLAQVTGHWQRCEHTYGFSCPALTANLREHPPARTCTPALLYIMGGKSDGIAGTQDTLWTLVFRSFYPPECSQHVAADEKNKNKTTPTSDLMVFL